jgi:hypothetical protein
MKKLLLYISILILFTQLTFVTTTSTKQFGSSFWCWYPCYCWYQFGVPFTGFYPKCWCWYPCGCWNRGFYNVANTAGGAGGVGARAYAAPISSGGPTSGPTPSGSPPSGRP